MSIYFAPVRREMAAKGFSKATIDALEAIATTAQSAATAGSGGSTDTTDLTALQALVTQLQTDLAAAEEAAADAPLLAPVRYFNPDDVKQVITDPASPVNIGTLLDSISATQGAVLYRSSTAWTALGPGTSGYLLQTNGPSANPSWVTPPAGSLTNPATLGTATFQQITGLPSSALPAGSLSLRSDVPRAYLSLAPNTTLPARVQEKSASGTYAVTLSSAPTQGNYLVAMCTHGASQPAANTGWTEISHHAQSGSDAYATLLYRLVDATDTVNQQPASGTPGAEGTVGIIEVSGIGGWADSFQSATYVSGGGTITSSTTTANTLLLAFGGWWGISATTTLSQGSAGWSNTVSSNIGGAAAQLSTSQAVVSSGTGYSSAITAAGAGNQMTAAVVSLRPPTTATTGPVPLSILTTLKSGGSAVTSFARSIDFTTGLSATDDGGGNTTVSAVTASSSQFGVVKVDGTTITASAGVISAVGGGGGGGGGGSWTTIQALTPLASPASTLTFSSIPGTYRDLQVVIYGNSVASDTYVTINFNSDTAANYRYIVWDRFAAAQSTSASAAQIGRSSGTANEGSELWPIDAIIYDYTNASFNKHVRTTSGLFGGGNYGVALGDAFWASHSAVTQIDLKLASGANWMAGSYAVLYGRQ